VISRLSATDVNQQDDADERDRTGDPDHTICAYASTKKSYFKSLGLGHGLSPSASDSPAEPNVGIWRQLHGRGMVIQHEDKMQVFSMG
jgi:hypothetical protein